jgi:hypothetical protein
LDETAAEKAVYFRGGCIENINGSFVADGTHTYLWPRRQQFQEHQTPPQSMIGGRMVEEVM